MVIISLVLRLQSLWRCFGRSSSICFSNSGINSLQKSSTRQNNPSKLSTGGSLVVVGELELLFFYQRAAFSTLFCFPYIELTLINLFPCLSAPWIWITFFAISTPITVTLLMTRLLLFK